MQANRTITEARYRSVVLTYLCTVSKVKGVTIKDLPGKLLDQIGVTFKRNAYLSSTSPRIVIPADLNSKETEKKLKMLEAYVRKHSYAAPPVATKTSARKRFSRYKDHGWDGDDG